MNKQIEEMVKDICKIERPCKECSAYPGACKAVRYAERFYHASYRKTSDIARRIFDEIYAAYDDCIYIDEREIGHLKVDEFLECIVNIDKKYTEGEDGDLHGRRCLITPQKTAEKLTEKGYRKAEDVAFEATDNFRDAIMDVFIDMCRGNDYNKLTLLQIGDAIDAVYDKQIANLKKKYESEEADDEASREG